MKEKLLQKRAKTFIKIIERQDTNTLKMLIEIIQNIINKREQK